MFRRAHPATQECQNKNAGSCSSSVRVASGPGRIRTCDQTVMHPTSAFAAPFGFVGWTIPSPRHGGLPSSLYTFPRLGAWLGITLSCDVGFPEFGRIYQEITLQAALCSDAIRCLEPSALPLSYGHLLRNLRSAFAFADSRVLIADCYLSGRRDSNPRISAWKADALPLGHARIRTTILP